MDNKNPIDRKRDSGGKGNIGTEEEGAIIEMINIDKNRLIVIKEKAIYEFMTADSIDPDRTNIALPNGIQKLLFNQGADSELVNRTFIQAKTLFKAQFFDSNIDIKKALFLSFDLLKEMIALQDEINKYLTKEEIAKKDYEEKRNKNSDFIIPSIIDIEDICKTIFQKAFHIEQIIMEIVVLFYPNEGLTNQSHFPKLYEVLKNKYGEENPFARFINKVKGFMEIVVSVRNSLDHRLGLAKIKDFELLVDGNILAPTIEHKYKEIILTKQGLFDLLPTILKNMPVIFENIIAYLCSANCNRKVLNYELKAIPKEQRRYKYVTYAFWSYLGTGFYHQ